MLRFGLVLLGLSSVIGLRYEGFKIYDVATTHQRQRDLLHQLSKQEDYDFFMLPKIAGQPSRVMVPPEKQEDFLQLLFENKMTFAVVNENVARSIDQEVLENRRQKMLNSRALSTERYYSHGEINDYLDALAIQYNDRVFVKNIGKSYEKRTIKSITITNGDARSDKKVIFVDGGFHAREWISPAAVVYVIGQLVDNFTENKDLLEDYDWVIIPLVNPDGYEYTQNSTSNRMWRKTRSPRKTSPFGITCYGADPNRNFDFHWLEEGAATSPCVEIYAGPAPFSEPETQVVRDQLFSIQDRCKFYLTIHSYGKYLIYPWSWTLDLPDNWEDIHAVAMAGYDAIFEETGTVYTVGPTSHVMYECSGVSDDYALGVVKIPISITMELPGGGENGFDPPPTSIDPYVKETWVGIRAMALEVVNKY